MSCFFLLTSRADDAYAQSLVDEGLITNIEQFAEQDVYLDVILNSRPTEVLAHFRISGDRLMIRPQDLHALGIAIESLELPAESWLPLDEIPQLRSHYDAGTQTVSIDVPPSLRRTYVYGGTPGRELPTPTSGRGLLLNYDAYYERADSDRLSIWNDLRFFNPSGVLESTGAAYWGHQSSSYVRFDTSWSQSDPDTMRTLRVGDTISSALVWTRPVRLAGVQWSSNFALRPDLVTFPVPQLTGTAVVPSSVDLYINNIRRTSTQVPDGPFLFNQAPGINGAGTATIITRDALGRSVATELPLYVDRRMLAQGLSAYSMEAGFLRQKYGEKSFSYEEEPVLSATLQYGVSDDLTIEAHTEAKKGLYNGGGGALFRLGTLGVINAALAGSFGDRSGSQAAIGYQYIGPRFSIDLNSSRSFGDYSDLGATEYAYTPRSIDRATLAFPFRASQSVAFSYINYRMRNIDSSRVGSVAYSANLGKRASMSLSAYKDFGVREDKGVLLSLSISFDHGVQANAYGGQQNGDTSVNASAQRSAPFDGGWGWGVQGGKAASINYAQGQAEFLGRYGDVSAGVQDYDGQSSFRASASGAAVLMDGNLALSRRIFDSFAMVSTAGVERVPVLHENREIGNSSSRGYYLVPNLNAYQANRIAIDGVNLPPNMVLATTEQIVVPQARSGVLVEFPISTYRAATIILKDGDNNPLPVGAHVHHIESGSESVVGYDGLAFIDNLQPQNHITVEYEGRHCAAEFSYQDPIENTFPTIGPVSCTLENRN